MQIFSEFREFTLVRDKILISRLMLHQDLIVIFQNLS